MKAKMRALYLMRYCSGWPNTHNTTMWRRLKTTSHSLQMKSFSSWRKVMLSSATSTKTIAIGWWWSVEMVSALFVHIYFLSCNVSSQYVKKRSRNVVVIDPFHNRVDDFERRLCDGFTKKAEKIPSWRKRREAVTIPHNTQSDGFSCGVYTMEVCKIF